MKGGIFALSEHFMKILSTAYLAIVLLSIFFVINQYSLIFLENRADRETLVVGNTVLSSCIAEVSGGYPVKGLLSEEKIHDEIQWNPTKDKNIRCFLNFNRGIYIEINESGSLLYGIGNSTICDNHPLNGAPCKKKTYTVFPAALNRTPPTSKIVPVSVNIFVGV